MRRFLSACLAFALVLLAAPLAQAQPTSQFFDSDGVQIHYTDQGTGEPVVLIHGSGGSLEMWEGSGIAPALAGSGYRVVSLDVRGHGKSGKPHDPASYGTKVLDDVIALLDHLAIPRAHMLGYSLGGGLILALLRDHQDRMLSAVAGGAGVFSPSDAATFEQDLPQGLRTGFASNADMAGRNDLEALVAFSQSGIVGLTLPTAETLPDIDVPIAAICGDADDLFCGAGKRLAELHPETQLTVVPGDHNAAGGSPEFAAAVQSFLDEVSGR